MTPNHLPHQRHNIFGTLIKITSSLVEVDFAREAADNLAELVTDIYELTDTSAMQRAVRVAERLRRSRSPGDVLALREALVSGIRSVADHKREIPCRTRAIDPNRPPFAVREARQLVMFPWQSQEDTSRFIVYLPSLETLISVPNNDTNRLALRASLEKASAEASRFRMESDLNHLMTDEQHLTPHGRQEMLDFLHSALERSEALCESVTKSAWLIEEVAPHLTLSEATLDRRRPAKLITDKPFGGKIPGYLLYQYLDDGSAVLLKDSLENCPGHISEAFSRLATHRSLRMLAEATREPMSNNAGRSAEAESLAGQYSPDQLRTMILSLQRETNRYERYRLQEKAALSRHRDQGGSANPFAGI